MKTELMNDLKESIEKSIKTSDLIGKRETLQQGLLAAKLNLDRYELNMQISRAHRPLKSEDNSNCQPIFAQFVSWRYTDEIRRKLIQLQATRKSKITVSQMPSEELTQRRNNASKRRKEMLQQSNDLIIYLLYRSRLTVRKRNSRKMYKQIKVF